MKARMRYQFSNEKQKAIDEEIARQAREFAHNLIEDIAIETDASILWALHEEFGWGKKRLKRFYDRAAAARKMLQEKYDMQNDGKFICLHKLKEIGVDVEEWSKSLPEHIRIHVG